MKSDFANLRRKHLPESHQLYISDHAYQRMVERDLAKEFPFVFAALKFFYNEIFLKTTYTNRLYRLEYKGLKIGITVCLHNVTERGRRCVLTTVMENDNAYEPDEVIKLK